MLTLMCFYHFFGVFTWFSSCFPLPLFCRMNGRHKRISHTATKLFHIATTFFRQATTISCKARTLSHSPPLAQPQSLPAQPQQIFVKQPQSLVTTIFRKANIFGEPSSSAWLDGIHRKSIQKRLSNETDCYENNVSKRVSYSLAYLSGQVDVRSLSH